MSSVMKGMTKPKAAVSGKKKKLGKVPPGPSLKMGAKRVRKR